jgi:hypothetical protein
MDKLKEMLTMDPCYEQHIVSIKQIYEDHLFAILVPAIYDGFQSLYRRAFVIESKFVTACKRNPDIENPGILAIYQTLIKEIPNLNTHKIRNETDRIKSSSKSADIFDDLVKAIVKANIILLTYNVDHKRKNLLQTKYHQNIIIHDFIHSCYIQSARNIYGCPELFYHELEPININHNKRACFKIIKDSVREAIRLMLPMKEILLEYITQKYEQKESPFNNPYNVNRGLNCIQGIPGGHLAPGMMETGSINGLNQDEFMDINGMVERDLRKFQGDDDHSLLEDEYDDGNAFDQEQDSEIKKEKDFTMLLTGSDGDGADFEENNKKSKNINDSIHDIPSIKPLELAVDKGQTNNDNTKFQDIAKIKTDKASGPEQSDPGDKIKQSVSDTGLKLIDISGTMGKRGPASTYFNDVMPDIKKRLTEYKQKKKEKKDSHKINIGDIEINRPNKITDGSPSETSKSKSKKSEPIEKDQNEPKEKDKIVDDIVDRLLK